jgi:hypothetical protein
MNYLLYPITQKPLLNNLNKKADYKKYQGMKVLANRQVTPFDRKPMTKKDDQEQFRDKHEYETLKSWMEIRTERFGSFLAAYLFLGASPLAAVCVLIGLGGSIAYLRLLCSCVDDKGRVLSPTLDEEQISNPFWRNFTLVILAYPEALQPRLFILVFIVTGFWVLSGTLSASSVQNDLIQEGSVLLGFLAFKFSLFQLLYETYQPGHTFKRRSLR